MKNEWLTLATGIVTFFTVLVTAWQNRQIKLTHGEKLAEIEEKVNGKEQNGA
jgi:hypothetical protein